MIERVAAGLVAVPFLLGAAATPVDQAEQVFSFQDSEIIESSGLVVVNGLVVTTNDSGDSGRVFAVDPANGRTVSTIQWEDDPTDVEALAPDGHGGVWVGDIGDNSEKRHTVQVADVPVTRSDAAVHPTAYDLTYPDGAHDAETLMTDPVSGRLYIATKEVFGGTLYAVPADLSPDHANQLQPVGPVLPIATDGAFLPDGRHVVVRNYGEAAVYAFPSLARVARFPVPDQEQGEGLAVDADDTLLLSSEGVHSAVLRVALPPLADAPRPTSAPTPAPTTDSPPQPVPEAATSEQRDRPAWPWLLGGLVGLGCVAVLVRSLRPR
jgi:hypothetical protein